MKKLATPFYPILLGVIWVLAVYAANRTVLPSSSEAILPALAVTGIIATVWGITQLIVRDWRKSALIVTVILCLTVAHGYIRDYTDVAGIKTVPIWLAMMAVGVFAVVKVTRPKGRETLTVVGNVICVCVLLVSFSVALTDLTWTRNREYSPVAIRELHNPLPDVYYIVPDTYASLYVQETYLDHHFGDEFYDFLFRRGFYVDPYSNANYHHSILSISSVMNMAYWTEDSMGTPTRQALGDALYGNPVGDTFVGAGYTYIHLGSWWAFTADNAAANITQQFSGLSELGFELFRITIWYDLLDYLFDAGGNRILREATLNQISSLPEVAKLEEPTFTFCHLILPHPPFLFDWEGNHVSGWAMPAEQWRLMYLDQLEYTNTLLEQTIDQILASSEVTPVIILCSDEGYAGTEWQEFYQQNNRDLELMLEVKPDLVRKRQGNLLAVLNPYGDVPSSPVNLFRCVFNGLFDSQLEYLPDRYFLGGIYEEPVDITEVING